MIGYLKRALMICQGYVKRYEVLERLRVDLEKTVEGELEAVERGWVVI